MTLVPLVKMYTVDAEKVAHYKLPHLDLHCLLSTLFDLLLILAHLLCPL